MPKRNKVPTLKMITTRKVAWPDGINRKETDVYPCAEQYCRDTMYFPFLNDSFGKLRKWVGIENLKETANNVVNYWIMLSNYYESTLADFKHMEVFFKMHPPKVLDFLHEGLTFRNETDKAKILPFIGVVPCTVVPQVMNATTWKSIVESLKTDDIILEVKELFVKFGEAQDPHVPKLANVEASFEFELTFEQFHNLTKLVVRGKADDLLLNAVGLNCYRLKHLDICQSEASDVGVRLVFYKGPEAEKQYHTFYTTAFSWNLPKYLLRPLTKSLEYFDMSEMPNVKDPHRFETSIVIACPQLVATPNLFFFCPRGNVRIHCRGFEVSPTLLFLRQHLILHVRSMFCADLFCFVRSMLACTHLESPALEVRVDEKGYEVGFLLLSGDLLIAYCELENLTVINFTSYTRSSCKFIPLEILGHLAPKLQRIKAPLKGRISDKYPLHCVKHVTSSVLYSTETLKSIVQRCPQLQYLEVREILLSLTSLDDYDIQDIFDDVAENLEVFRILFHNRITLSTGMTWIITNCPQLQIVGDLKFWNLSEKSFNKLQKQLGLHNFRIAIEFDGVIHFSNTSCVEFSS